MLGAESGTLASQNYPGTYPSNAWCRWRLRVAEGRTLRLLFGDFDIESSPGCGNGSLLITGDSGGPGLGKSASAAPPPPPRLSRSKAADGVPRPPSRQPRGRRLS